MKQEILNKLAMISNWFGYKTNSPDAYIWSGVFTAWGLGKKGLAFSFIFLIIGSALFQNGGLMLMGVVI